MEELAYKIQADFIKGLAHPIRLQIIELLKKGEQNVGNIVKALGVQQASLSRHLTILKESGILAARQQGLLIYYRIGDCDIFKILKPIRTLLCKRLKKTEGALRSLERA
ncbi:MAG: metalloregulator ArsR/SmtB family transcription factor [Candidatus Omnitrophota bacterium]